MFIAELQPTPQLIHQGKTNVVMTFLGTIDPTNNPANLTLTLNVDPANSNIVFIDENNNETLQLTWQQQMKNTKDNYQKSVVVNLKASNGTQSGASITLNALDSNADINNRDFDNCGSHIDYI